jgi:hypothetical protein
LETYLQCFAYERQNQWNQWLPLVQWWYNTSYHTITCITPFEAVYGKKRPLFLSYMRGVSTVQEVDNNLAVCESIFRTLKTNLVMTHNRMKKQVDKGHSEQFFFEGDRLCLCLQPHKQTSLKTNHCQNLAPKFYGPYTIIKRVGHVAYQLYFPSHYNLHLVFHVS